MRKLMIQVTTSELTKVILFLEDRGIQTLTFTKISESCTNGAGTKRIFVIDFSVSEEKAQERDFVQFYKQYRGNGLPRR